MEDGYLEHEFCDACGIIFSSGETHAINGCTFDTQNALLVESFTISKMINGEKIPGKTIVGMPRFKSYRDWLTVMNTIDITWASPSANVPYCTGASYPKK